MRVIQVEQSYGSIMELNHEISFSDPSRMHLGIAFLCVNLSLLSATI